MSGLPGGCRQADADADGGAQWPWTDSPPTG